MAGETKETPLYSEHISLGAKMVDFHGWQMPLYYQGITEEVKAVREQTGLFDLSHMGEIIVEGERAAAFLQFMTVNNVLKLEAGKMQYSLFLDSQGAVLEDFMLYRLEDRFMAVVNACNTAKIFEHLKKQKFKEVEIADLTDNLVLIGIQGPKSEEILRKFCSKDMPGFKYLRSKEMGIAGMAVLVSRSGYTGEDGFEICVEKDKASKIWRTIIEEGRPLGLKPAGLGARDILRCEMGYPLYGQEWDRTVTPWEAGFSWVVKLDKDFLGKEALIARQEKTSRQLVGFVMKEKAVPRTGYPIKYGQQNIGRVTSGTFSPTRGDFIGMGYLLKDFAREGITIKIGIREKLVPAEIVKLPFVKPHLKRTG